MFMIAGAILFGITLILKRIGHPRGIGSAFHRAGGPTPVESTFSRVAERHSTGQAQTRTDTGPSADGRGKMDEGRWGKAAQTKTAAAPNNPNVLNNPDGHMAAGWTKPVVLTAMVCLMFVTSGYALKKIPSARNLPQREDFKSFPMQIGNWQGKRSYIEQEILDQLWADDYVQATYFKPRSSNAIHVLIPFYEYQGTRHTAHAPQSCLLGGGWALTESKERTIKMVDGKQITLMTMNLQKGNAKVLGSYFFFMRGRVITSPWINKFYLMWDSFSRQRTDGALVRAEMVVAPGQSTDEAWGELAGFISGLWEVLPRYVPK